MPSWPTITDGTTQLRQVLFDSIKSYIDGLTTLVFSNTGLKISDTNASHNLTIAPGSDLTADRTLTVTTGDAARTLTISGNATVSQDTSSAGSPTFTGLTTTSDTSLGTGSGSAVTLGGGGSPTELRFLESSMGGSNYMAFKAQGMAGNVTYWLPAADGSSGQLLSTNGSGTLSWATAADTSTKLTAINVYTSSTTWSKPAGLYAVVVWVVGGGGGGAGAPSTAGGQTAVGGNGAGAGASLKRIVAGSLGSTETVTVGAGGAGGAAGNNNGSSGGTSSFGAHLSATGGGFGYGQAAVTPPANAGSAGWAGTGSSGDVNFKGAAGNPGAGLAGGGGNAYSGVGGNSIFGGGGPSAYNEAGMTGGNYGGGGSGAANSQSNAARAGGAGAGGVVIVYEYVTA